MDDTPNGQTAPPTAIHATSSVGGPKKGAPPTKRLPTPRIAFNRQLDLLRAYSAASNQGAKAASNDDVAALVQMAPATVSLANPFFSDVGFLQRADGGYLPDSSVVSFARVHQWNPDKAGAELAPRLRESWFGHFLLTQLTYSSVLEEDAVMRLGAEAEAAPGYRSQVETLLDYLEVAGVVVRENGQVRRGGGESATVATTTTVSGDEKQPYTESGPPITSVTTVSSAPASVAPRLPLLIQGLLEQLPDGETWTRRDADKWLALARLTFEFVYEIEPEPERGEPS